MKHYLVALILLCWLYPASAQRVRKIEADNVSLSADHKTLSTPDGDVSIGPDTNIRIHERQLFAADLRVGDEVCFYEKGHAPVVDPATTGRVTSLQPLSLVTDVPVAPATTSPRLRTYAIRGYATTSLSPTTLGNSKAHASYRRTIRVTHPEQVAFTRFTMRGVADIQTSETNFNDREPVCIYAVENASGRLHACSVAILRENPRASPLRLGDNLRKVLGALGAPDSIQPYFHASQWGQGVGNGLWVYRFHYHITTAGRNDHLVVSISANRVVGIDEIAADYEMRTVKPSPESNTGDAAFGQHSPAIPGLPDPPQYDLSGLNLSLEPADPATPRLPERHPSGNVPPGWGGEQAPEEPTGVK